MATANQMTEADKALRSEIAAAAQRGYPFYVYALGDARSTFYVGKGKGSRLFQHGRRKDGHVTRQVWYA